MQRVGLRASRALEVGSTFEAGAAEELETTHPPGRAPVVWCSGTRPRSLFSLPRWTTAVAAGLLSFAVGWTPIVASPLQSKVSKTKAAVGWVQPSSAVPIRTAQLDTAAAVRI